MKHFKLFLMLFYVQLVQAQAPSEIEAIDLGLPSGKLWASCNIGANHPEEFGDLFAWGEIATKTEFNQTNYVLFKSTTSEPDAEGFTTTISGYTKYVLEIDASTYGFNGAFDNLSILEKEDDAAYVLWGEQWEMPSWIDVMELRQQCSWEWRSQNGIEGYKVTGPNGKYIFLPAAGYNDGRKTSGCGRYWSNCLDMENPNSRTAPCLDFSKWDVSGYSGNRYYGYSIRPVFRGDNPVKPTPCEAPSISYSKGHLSFSSNTEGSKFVYSIKCEDVNSATVDEGIELSATYCISVYAIAEGFDRSEVSTATLCWLDVDPKTEGIENSVAQVRANAVLIQSHDGTLSITGVDDGTDIAVYSTSGQMVGSAKAHGSTSSVTTTLRSGNVAIVRIGDKSVKVVMQ